MLHLDAHVEMWLAIVTSAAATGAFLLRTGAYLARMLAKIDELHENQQVLATKAGVTLPHPYVEK